MPNQTQASITAAATCRLIQMQGWCSSSPLTCGCPGDFLTSHPGARHSSPLWNGHVTHQSPRQDMWVATGSGRNRRQSTISWEIQSQVRLVSEVDNTIFFSFYLLIYRLWEHHVTWQLAKINLVVIDNHGKIGEMQVRPVGNVRRFAGISTIYKLNTYYLFKTESSDHVETFRKSYILRRKTRQIFRRHHE